MLPFSNLSWGSQQNSDDIFSTPAQSLTLTDPAAMQPQQVLTVNQLISQENETRMVANIIKEYTFARDEFLLRITCPLWEKNIRELTYSQWIFNKAHADEVPELSASRIVGYRSKTNYTRVPRYGKAAIISQDVLSTAEGMQLWMTQLEHMVASVQETAKLDILRTLLSCKPISEFYRQYLRTDKLTIEKMLSMEVFFFGNMSKYPFNLQNMVSMARRHLQIMAIEANHLVLPPDSENYQKNSKEQPMNLHMNAGDRGVTKQEQYPYSTVDPVTTIVGIPTYETSSYVPAFGIPGEDPMTSDRQIGEKYVFETDTWMYNIERDSMDLVRLREALQNVNIWDNLRHCYNDAVLAEIRRLQDEFRAQGLLSENERRFPFIFQIDQGLEYVPATHFGKLNQDLSSYYDTFFEQLSKHIQIDFFSGSEEKQMISKIKIKYVMNKLTHGVGGTIPAAIVALIRANSPILVGGLFGGGNRSFGGLYSWEAIKFFNQLPANTVDDYFEEGGFSLQIKSLYEFVLLVISAIEKYFPTTSLFHDEWLLDDKADAIVFDFLSFYEKAEFTPGAAGRTGAGANTGLTVPGANTTILQSIDANIGTYVEIAKRVGGGHTFILQQNVSPNDLMLAALLKYISTRFVGPAPTNAQYNLLTLPSPPTMAIIKTVLGDSLEWRNFPDELKIDPVVWWFLYQLSQPDDQGVPQPWPNTPLTKSIKEKLSKTFEPWKFNAIPHSINNNFAIRSQEQQQQAVASVAAGGVVVFTEGTKLYFSPETATIILATANLLARTGVRKSRENAYVAIADAAAITALERELILKDVPERDIALRFECFRRYYAGNLDPRPAVERRDPGAPQALQAINVHRSGIDFFYNFDGRRFRENFIALRNQSQTFIHHILGTAFLFTPCDRMESWMTMVDAKIRIPMNIVVARPHIQIRMASGILMKAGMDTARTIWGFPDVTFGLDSKTKVVSANVTVRIKPVVTIPENIIVLPNIKYNGYRGGGTTEWIKSLGDLQMEPERRPSLYAFAVGFGESTGCPYMDIAGSWRHHPILDGFGLNYLELPKDLSYSTGRMYARMWNWEHEFAINADPAIFNFGDQSCQFWNRVCCQGLQVGRSSIDQRFTHVTPSAGHLGDDGSMPGARSVIDGRQHYFEQHKDYQRLLAIVNK